MTKDASFSKELASDRETMKAIARQDRTAFSRLMAQYGNMVTGTAFRLLGNRADAEDTAQDVFVKLWRNASRYDPDYRLSTWLYRITCNLCYDRLRCRKKWWPLIRLSGPESNRPEQAEPESLYGKEVSAEEKIIAGEMWDLFEKITGHLSPKQKTVFVLKELEELSNEEIASVTGLSSEQIKSNLYQARKTVRRKFEACYANPKHLKP